jgi:hypothetical protein
MCALPPYLQNLHQKLLTETTPTTAHTIISEYLRFFGIEGVQEDLWQLLVGALSSDEVQGLDTGRHRHDLIFFYEFTMLFVKAVDMLHKESVEKESGSEREAPA